MWTPGSPTTSPDHAPGSLLDALRERARHTPNAVAMIAGDDPWTCARLADESARLAGSLLARGVAAGDRVALHMLNIPELVVSCLALLHVGAIAVPVNTRYKTDEIAALFERIRPALYIGQQPLYDVVETIDESLLAPRSRFVVGFDETQQRANAWSTLFAGASVAGDEAPRDPDAPAILLATSGTTGQSKLVVWTGATLAALQHSAVARGISSSDTLLINVPMMHGSGVYYLASCIRQGAVAVMLPQFEPDAALDAIEAHRCTTFFGLPFMCAQLVQRQRERARDLSSLRLCTVAGDVCPAEVERAFESVVGRRLFTFWAAAEDVGAMIPATRVGPFFRAAPGTEFRIVDEDGREVDAACTGEIIVRSPTTTPGYWEEGGELRIMSEGWFESGDLVRREPDGQLRYMGRKKDLIVRGGSNISPVEVEAAMLAHPAVIDAAVAGLPDAALGQRVVAVVVLVDGAGPDVFPDILATLGRQLADYKIPERLVSVDAVARNALTKIDRRAVLDQILRGQEAAC